MANQVAPAGQVWVCAACGKRSRDRYGFQKIDHGWDASCMLNAVLCIDTPVLLHEGGRSVYRAAPDEATPEEGGRG